MESCTPSPPAVPCSQKRFWKGCTSTHNCAGLDGSEVSVREPPPPMEPADSLPRLPLSPSLSLPPGLTDSSSDTVVFTISATLR